MDRSVCSADTLENVRLPGGQVGVRRTNPETVAFRVWAPRCREVLLRIHQPESASVAMTPTGGGYFEAVLDSRARGIRYSYVLDGVKDRPDPASCWQPEGVHGPSAVADEEFAWEATHWQGIPLREYVLYELHVGAFTPEGTLDAAIRRLPYLRDLGVTAVELMPVAACPGERNWGYDGVYPYAVQDSYGGPQALKRFVDACHLNGLVVVLDVVYNHLGPEGNYLRDFGPYFTARHHTPWGEAINYDGADSGPVREFFLQNALYWVTEFRIDALRLDATDTIYDLSPRHFLEELATAIRERGEALNRRIYTIAESAANDARWIRPVAQGGFGLDAQWNDDIHHALRRSLTGETQGYFADYPHLRQLAKGLRDGFIYTGEYSAYRKRKHGSASADLPPSRFVVCCQNHDQAGNRMRGDRLGHALPLPALKLAAAWVLLSPYIPLLFMGEEYNEPAPFPYFVHHGDPDLIAAVREGRKKEFAAFAWDGEPPDPQDEATFLAAKVHPELHQQGAHAELFRWYQRLLALRKTHPCFRAGTREGMDVVCEEEARTIWVRRQTEDRVSAALFHFGDRAAMAPFPFDAGQWRDLLRGPEGGDAERLTRGSRLSVEPYAVRVFERIPEVTPVVRLTLSGEDAQVLRQGQKP